MNDESKGSGLRPLADVDDLIRRLEQDLKQGRVTADRGVGLLLMEPCIASTWPTGEEEPCTASAAPTDAEQRAVGLLADCPPDRPQALPDRGRLGTCAVPGTGDFLSLSTRDVHWALKVLRLVSAERARLRGP